MANFDSENEVHTICSDEDEVESDLKEVVHIVTSKGKRQPRRFKGELRHEKASKGRNAELLKKVIIAHKQIGIDGWKDFFMVPITHPKTKIEARFLVDFSAKDKKSTGIVYEILTLRNEQDLTSWFCGEFVVSDGNIYAITPVDPLFLIIPAIAKCSKARPLYDHLEDVLPSKVAQVFAKLISSAQIENIATKKVAGDITAFLYSEDRVLDWLLAKVERLTSILKEKKIRSSETSVSLNYAKSDKDPGSEQEYQRYACDIVGEYVDDILKNKLLEKLGLPVEPLRTKRKNSGIDEESSKKFKSSGDEVQVEPTEDYGSSVSVKPSPKTQASINQKRLAAAAKGTHSLFKFFTPKSK